MVSSTFLSFFPGLGCIFRLFGVFINWSHVLHMSLCRKWIRFLSSLWRGTFLIGTLPEYSFLFMLIRNISISFQIVQFYSKYLIVYSKKYFVVHVISRFFQMIISRFVVIKKRIVLFLTCYFCFLLFVCFLFLFFLICFFFLYVLTICLIIIFLFVFVFVCL